MGGRGASSGISEYGNVYGSQYHSVFESGNIKFVIKNPGATEELQETMTRGRVYVRVDDGNNLRQIVYFDNENRRSKSIDLGHAHQKEKPHTHHGYNHSENDSTKGFSKLTDKEKQMVERVQRIWNNHINS